MDIKETFDSVCVDVLAGKLHKSDLSTILNMFLYSLLFKKQIGFVHGDLTIPQIHNRGFPQGSCLSPILYNCTLRRLADDCVVSKTG